MQDVHNIIANLKTNKTGKKMLKLSISSFQNKYINDRQKKRQFQNKYKIYYDSILKKRTQNCTENLNIGFISNILNDKYNEHIYNVICYIICCCIVSCNQNKLNEIKIGTQDILYFEYKLKQYGFQIVNSREILQQCLTQCLKKYKKINFKQFLKVEFYEKY